MAIFTVLCLIISHCVLFSNGFESKVEEAFVVGESIVAFTSNVSTQGREDIRNATVFSQLTADYKYNSEKDSKNWFQFFSDVLTRIGFVLQSFITPQYVDNDKFTMEEVALDTLENIARSSQVALAKTAIDALGPETTRE